MISDALLHEVLSETALVLTMGAECDGEADPALLPGLFIDQEVLLLPMIRAVGAIDGRGLFAALARQKKLVVDEDQWPRLPERARVYFDCLARLMCAFAAPIVAAGDGPALKIVPASPRRVRDTIFERTGGKADAFEKTGGLDLAPGQPTSTAQVTIELPDPRPRFNPEQDEINRRFTSAGLKPPIGANDAGDAADYVGEQLGAIAPPAPPPERVKVNRFVDGSPVSGDVFISRPPTLAANAPKLLRADPNDAGPEQA
jgi:hypothetical protein